MNHVHRTLAAPALAAAAQATLERAGEQWTALRGAVYHALAGFGRPASAYDVTEAVSLSLGRRIAPNSVYRILDLFTGAAIATRIESRNAFVPNSHPGCAHDCIFLVCDECGGATHLDDDALAGGLRAAATARGFAAVRPVIEVRGRCGACA